MHHLSHQRTKRSLKTEAVVLTHNLWINCIKSANTRATQHLYTTTLFNYFFDKNQSL